jgi:myosin-crossreactive antigen
MEDSKSGKAYLLGAGIASLANAAYLIRDGQISGKDICIPFMLPFITSQFLLRGKADRPAVVPKGSVILAFIGQYCEMPEDVVFTVEYSIRSAQMAVFC